MAVKYSYKSIGKNLLIVLLFSILNILCCEISEDLSSRYREISYWYLPAGMFYAVFVTLGFRYIAHLFIAVIIGSYFCVKILGCSVITSYSIHYTKLYDDKSIYCLTQEASTPG